MLDDGHVHVHDEVLHTTMLLVLVSGRDAPVCVGYRQ